LYYNSVDKSVKEGDGVRRTARSFIVLCVAACIVAALLGGALLSARHGAHRFFCADEHCKICFTVEACLNLIQGWGLIALGISLFIIAVFSVRALAGILYASTQRHTLFALGIRLNS
jgi:hypothetical protein